MINFILCIIALAELYLLHKHATICINSIAASRNKFFTFKFTCSKTNKTFIKKFKDSSLNFSHVVTCPHCKNNLLFNKSEIIKVEELDIGTECSNKLCLMHQKVYRIGNKIVFLFKIEKIVHQAVITKVES